MPTYEYKCDNGHTFDAMQSMSEDALDSCEVCGAPARRVLHAPAVHFKGSGFYTTDYARKKGEPRRRRTAPIRRSRTADRTRRAPTRRATPAPRSGSGDKAAAKKD